MTITKSAKASRSFGRGSDSYTQPARYKVLDGGKTIGHIKTGKREFMSSTVWEVVAVHPENENREIRVGLTHKTLRGAKAWAVENIIRIKNAWRYQD